MIADWNLPGAGIWQAVQWGAWITLFAFFLFAAFAMWRIAQRFAPIASLSEQPSVRPARAEGAVEQLPFSTPERAIDFLAEAQRLGEQGNREQAIVYLYAYLLRQLDNRQIIHLQKAKTNRQYLAELGSEPSVRTIVATIAGVFEAVFFGGKSLPADRWSRCWRDVQALDAVLAQHGERK